MASNGFAISELVMEQNAGTFAAVQRHYCACALRTQFPFSVSISFNKLLNKLLLIA